jgi:hypothetical protein
MNIAAEMGGDFRRRHSVLIHSIYYDIVLLNISDEAFGYLLVIDCDEPFYARGDIYIYRLTTVN